MCPNPSSVFDSTNANPSSVRSVLDFNTNQILGSEFDYKCQSGFVLFVSKNGGDYERAPSDSITYECLRRTGSTFDPSIRENGRPKCMSWFLIFVCMHETNIYKKKFRFPSVSRVAKHDKQWSCEGYWPRARCYSNLLLQPRIWS